MPERAARESNRSQMIGSSSNDLWQEQNIGISSKLPLPSSRRSLRKVLPNIIRLKPGFNSVGWCASSIASVLCTVVT